MLFRALPTSLIVLSAVLIVWSTARGEESSGSSTLLNQSYWLEKGQRSKLAVEALEGSVSAAERLVDYHTTVTRNDSESLKWSLIAAENGSSRAPLFLFQLLRESRHETDQRRALFWLRRASELGDNVGESLFKACSTLDSVIDKRPCFGPLPKQGRKK
jgi:hypothetical protein